MADIVYCRFYDAKNKNLDGSLKLITAKCIPFDSKADAPNGFGNTDETGCKNNPLEFHFSYSASGTPTPTVQVLDNWGWCSGECRGGSYGASGMPNGGCYNDGVFSDCRLENTNPTLSIYPWVEYGGILNIK